MTGKIFLKLIAGVLGLLLLALGLVDYFATDVAHDSYIQSLKDQLAGKCRMLELSLAAPESLDAVHARRMAAAAGGRVTVIRADGKVLVDSEANAAEMENHRTRHEVAQAFASGSGSDSRESATVHVKFLYVAVRVTDGSAVIRIAMPLSEIDRQVSQIRGKLLASTALAFLPAVLIAAILARFISRRMARIMAHAGELDRKSTRLNSSHVALSRMPSSAGFRRSRSAYARAGRTRSNRSWPAVPGSCRAPARLHGP